MTTTDVTPTPLSEGESGPPEADAIRVVPDEPTAPSWRGRLRTITDRLAGWLAPVWDHRRIGSVAAIGVAASWGLIAGLWTPRSPLTTGQAIWSIAISLLVGAAAGLVLRSRWAMLIAPAVFAVVFEVVRRGTDGPTVDGIEFTTYGIFAFVVGRGFHALLSLLPLSFGAADRRRGRPDRHPGA